MEKNTRRPHYLNVNTAHVPLILVTQSHRYFAMRRSKILIVEDDDDLRALYSYMLAAGGYKVKAVRNGLEALAEIQVNRPDVIVTDIIRPGLSGLDLIAAVRSNDELADLPVVAITSFGESLREEARAAGATDSIDKPTEIARMREMIEAAVSRSSSAQLRSRGVRSRN
jgi:CheY-like chemotaxis protein